MSIPRKNWEALSNIIKKHTENIADKTKIAKLIDESHVKIVKDNPILNDFITIADKELLATEIKNATEGLLTGIPVALKDNIAVETMRMTCGSKMLENFDKPLYTATVAQKLIAAGSIIMGKLNMDEFAMGASNETSYFGPVKNPYNLEYVSGGSSGGLAVAVANGSVNKMNRYGRFGEATGFFYQYSWYEANIWSNFTFWCNSIRFFARSSWNYHKNG